MIKIAMAISISSANTSASLSNRSQLEHDSLDTYKPWTVKRVLDAYVKSIDPGLLCSPCRLPWAETYCL